MKPIEKLWCTTGALIAWIGIWLIGPENPGERYDMFEIAVFYIVVAICIFAIVKFYSQLIQQRMSEEMKRKLRRRDARPGR